MNSSLIQILNSQRKGKPEKTALENQKEGARKTRKQAAGNQQKSFRRRGREFVANQNGQLRKTGKTKQKKHAGKL